MKKSLKRRAFEKAKALVLSHPLLMRYASFILNRFPSMKLRLKQKLAKETQLVTEPIIKLTTEDSVRIQALEKMVQRTIQDIRNEHVL
jgi:hypothetical protein